MVSDVLAAFKVTTFRSKVINVKDDEEGMNANKTCANYNSKKNLVIRKDRNAVLHLSNKSAEMVPKT